jgi:hypothetical protein
LQKQSEIMFFLLFVIVVRARKTGSVTMLAYLSTGFMYCKVASLILWFNADPRYGLVYVVLLTCKWTITSFFNIIIINIFLFQYKQSCSQSLHTVGQKKLSISMQHLWMRSWTETRRLFGLLHSTLFGAQAVSILLQSIQNYQQSMFINYF